eukprot:1325140-Prymnesium_polylepis.1
MSVGGAACSVSVVTPSTVAASVSSPRGGAPTLGGASPACRTSITSALYDCSRLAHTTSTPYLAIDAAALASKMARLVSSLNDTTS